MKKFDRVTAILLQLQTRSVVRAKDLADLFDVTERTIYRDIRTLENAGVPIGAEPGVGFYLDKSYQLPPVMFSRDEAAAMLIGSKIIENQVDGETKAEFQQAMSKVRSVLDSSDRQYLDIINDDIAVHAPRIAALSAHADKWLRDCRTALSGMQPMSIEYEGRVAQASTSRDVEPVGLYFYSHHWHLIGWCRLREGYRDFRLDRISQLRILDEQFRHRDHRNLKEYLQREPQYESLHEIKLLFSREAAQFVDEQRYYYGFVEELITDEGVEMTFLVPYLPYFAGWLLQYSDGVDVVSGDEIRPIIATLLASLSEHWAQRPQDA